MIDWERARRGDTLFWIPNKEVATTLMKNTNALQCIGETGRSTIRKFIKNGGFPIVMSKGGATGINRKTFEIACEHYGHNYYMIDTTKIKPRKIQIEVKI